MIYDKVRCEGNFIAWSRKIGPFSTFDSGFITPMNDKIAGWKILDQMSGDGTGYVPIGINSAFSGITCKDLN